jgi:hypothetical protein
MTTPHDELPKTISSQKVFEGRVFNVTVDTVREGQLTYQREVVHHGGSAVTCSKRPPVLSLKASVPKSARNANFRKNSA